MNTPCFHYRLPQHFLFFFYNLNIQEMLCFIPIKITNRRNGATIVTDTCRKRRAKRFETTVPEEFELTSRKYSNVCAVFSSQRYPLDLEIYTGAPLFLCSMEDKGPFSIWSVRNTPCNYESFFLEIILRRL